MKLVSKIIVLLMVWVVLISAQSVVIDQIVRNLPIADVAGCHWAIYDLDNAESRVCYENGIACVTAASAEGLFWSAEIGFNFPSPVPEVGDSILIIGSWDSAYVNPGEYGNKSSHTGFYWLYSDTLDDPQAIEWRDDTLRPLPKPIATQVGWPTGNILISITNPKETRYTGQSVYDVLGFWIWADTTSGTHHDTAGRPDYFDLEVGFFSVDGDPGEITICTHSDSIYHDEQTVYWAYKLVARPDTVNASSDTMGYSTYYFSQNSNPLTNIGIEENTSLKPECIKFEISPNPFTDRTNITCSIGQSANGTELKIYDISGKLVKDFSHFTLDARRPTLLSWDGTDESGEQLPSGVYFIQAKGGDLNLTKKVILQR